jgi:hypothetical protein
MHIDQKPKQSKARDMAKPAKSANINTCRQYLAGQEGSHTQSSLQQSHLEPLESVTVLTIFRPHPKLEFITFGIQTPVYSNLSIATEHGPGLGDDVDALCKNSHQPGRELMLGCCPREGLPASRRPSVSGLGLRAASQ